MEALARFEVMSLTKQEFDYIRKWAKERSAISLEDDKEYLVTSRLTPVLRRRGLKSIKELIDQLSVGKSALDLEEEVVDAMTTNETFFFRDGHPFDLIRDRLLPELASKFSSERRLSIWSAACSTGQEIYSVAMVIREHFPELLGWDLQLYATDLSPTVVAKAKAGIYSDMEARRGLTDEYRNRYFRKLEKGRWQINDSLRQMVEFRQLNFLDPWPDVGVHHLVLMRNVLIYFQVEDKVRIMNRVRQRLDPHGFMLLGTSETTLNIDPNWTPLRNAARSTFFVPLQGNC